MGEHSPPTFTARGHLIARWDPLCGLERLDIVSASGNACTCQNPPRSDRFGCIRTDSICPSLPSREQPCCSRRGSFYREWDDASSFFSQRAGFFFALLLPFPPRKKKDPACRAPKAPVIKKTVVPSTSRACITRLPPIKERERGASPHGKPPHASHDNRSAICPGPGRPAGRGRSRRR